MFRLRSLFTFSVFAMVCVAAQGQKLGQPRKSSEQQSLKSARMVVLGDSLSDVGRHFAKYGTPAAPSYKGRYSNGPVWVEHLARTLGLSAEEVRNYAMGGAASGDENCCTEGADGLLDELRTFLAEPKTGFAPGSALYVLWIGANDFEIWRQEHDRTGAGPEVLIEGALENITQVFEGLIGAGARRFLVANLPDLGRIPRTQAMGNEVAELATTGTILFNTNLAWLLSQIEHAYKVDITYLDVFSLFGAIQAKPSAFGFDNATDACLAADGSMCPDPNGHVFWDDRHPSSAAHELLAKAAFDALKSGGALLPPADCDPAVSRVQITTQSGLFTTESAVRITGKIDASTPAGAELLVNGIPVAPAADGAFFVDVGLSPDSLVNPILAELSLDGRVLDRDRIEVFHGPSLKEGDVARDAVLVDLNSNGVSAIRDEVSYQLFKSGLINIAPYIPNPLKSDFSGQLQYVANPTFIGYSCHTVDAELHQGFVRLRFALHDIRVDYHVKAWLDDIPDPGFNADGGFHAANFSLYMDVAFAPKRGGRAGEVEVTALSPVHYDLVNFRHIVYHCDFDINGLVTDLFYQLVGNVEGYVRGAIEDHLVSPDVIATEIERMLAAISISGPVGDGLGVTLTGDIQSISHLENQVAVWFKTGFSSAVPGELATYAVPTAPLQHTTLDPVAGKPYDFAASVSLKTLNQLLLAKADELFGGLDLTELDLGLGPQPITARLLSLFIPSLRAEDPDRRYALRVRPTLPPMLVDGDQVAGSDATLFMGQVLVEIVPQDTEVAELAMAVDLRAGMDFSFQASSLQMSVVLSADSVQDVVMIENQLCADEPALIQLTRLMVAKAAQDLTSSLDPLPLPDLYGMKLKVTQIYAESGYISLFFTLDPDHGRADLTVSEIRLPDAIDVNFPFDVSFLVKNTGHAVAQFGAWMGASLSLDPAYLNGDDIGLSQAFFDLARNPLSVGESRWFKLTIPPIPWAKQAEQTLFVTADVPAVVGGAGMLWESSELNNHAGATILTTTADAYVAWVDPPEGLIGGIGPGAYQVRVGRSNVGLDYMQVPVHVQVGNPVLTWWDVMVSVARGSETTVTVYVPTPFSYGNAGQVNHFPVLACTNLWPDGNGSNNCASATVDVAVPYWDLRFDVDGDTSARSCSNTLDWQVKVTNVGNINSMNVCAFTTLCRYSGAGNYGACFPFVYFTTPNIMPGKTWTWSVRDYAICNAYIGTQYLKAEINYSAGCFDLNSSGNFAQQSITIKP